MAAREWDYSYYREEGGVCETEGSYIVVGVRRYGGQSGNAICFACSSLLQNTGTPGGVRIPNLSNNLLQAT